MASSFWIFLNPFEISLREEVFVGVYEAFLTPHCLIAVAETRIFAGQEFLNQSTNGIYYLERISRRFVA